MSVRDDYRVVGMSTAQVRELQKALGVTADGAWGNQSQAALEKAYGANADPLAVFKGSGSGSSAGAGLGQSGLGAAASSQQPAQPALSNGYAGSYYTGKDGNNYTDYGALLRNDGFFYPEGARISPNGMYVDVGNGWQFAKYGVAFDKKGPLRDRDGAQLYVPSSVTGLAPGARIPGFEGGGSTDATAPGAADPEPKTDEEKAEWELYLERELKRYQEEWLSGYID